MFGSQKQHRQAVTKYNENFDMNNIDYKENNKISRLNRYLNKRIIKRTMVITAAAAAALIIFSVARTFSRRNNNIAYSMEKETETVKDYHSIIEYTESNRLGETVTQSGKEVWADRQGNNYVKELDDTPISGKPQIEVDIDLEAEENAQKSVDEGHSPWKLDPVFVTQVFASLLLSPEGIVGDYPIPYEAITITENNGIEATAVINDDKSVARTVYLKRLVRQDESGIWTVIGYDINTEE